MKPVLKDYQKRAIASIQGRANTLLLARVGSGKTAIALEAIARTGRTLVLGTTRICQSVWPAETRIWQPHLACVSVAGLSAKKRELLVRMRADILCLNYENLEWAIRVFGPALAEWYPNLIVDESTRLRNPATKTFKAVRNMLGYFKRRVAMTGTPKPNYLHQLWGQAYLVDEGRALGRYKEAFLQHWFLPVQQGRFTKWQPRNGAEEKILGALEGIVHLVEPDAVKGLPEVRTIDVILPLNDMVRRVQQTVARHLDHAAEAKVKKEPIGDCVVLGGRVTMARADTPVTAKLMQLPSGDIYGDDGLPIILHSDKYDALDEIISEAQGDPILLLYAFDHEAQILQGAYPEAVLLKGDEQVQAWNRGEIPILLAHPKSCGHGLNLQAGGSVLVWFSPPGFDAELYSQAIGRLARTGQESPVVRVYRLIMEGTGDEAAYQVIEGRVKSEEDMMEAIKRILQRS